MVLFVAPLGLLWFNLNFSLVSTLRLCSGWFQTQQKHLGNVRKTPWLGSKIEVLVAKQTRLEFVLSSPTSSGVRLTNVETLWLLVEISSSHL